MTGEKHESSISFAGNSFARCTFSSAHAQNKAVKIGVLNDQSGVYADDQGIGSVIAAQLAVEDFPRNSGLSFEVTRATTRTRSISGPPLPAAGSTRRASQ